MSEHHRILALAFVYVGCAILATLLAISLARDGKSPPVNRHFSLGVASSLLGTSFMASSLQIPPLLDLFFYTSGVLLLIWSLKPPTKQA